MEHAIRIRSVEDFQELADNCKLDSWSVDKVVILENDLDFTDMDFVMIPTFGGIFFGDNHMIKGINLEGTNNFLGCFRYVQKTGEIYDLSIEGTFTAGSKQSGLGMLAGENRGI